MRCPRRPSILAVTALLVLVGCGSEPAPRPTVSATLHDDTITVASFDFAESRLLAEIYAQVLEAAGVRVRREFGLGPRELVGPALVQGVVELVPEYAGTALQFLRLGAASPADDPDATVRALREAAARVGITVLESAPAQDANTFVVTSVTARERDLRRISDLAADAADLTFGGPPECPARALCLAGLEDTYGLTFKEFVRLDAGGPVTLQALRNGDVDVALLFTTDPAIRDGDLVELEDDRGLQPAENITPLVRDEVVARWGTDVTDALDSVAVDLTTAELRDLNGRIASGSSIADVAGAWLRSRGGS